MSHIRLLKHYVNLPFLFLGIAEFALFYTLGVNLAVQTGDSGYNDLLYVPYSASSRALIFACCMACCTLAMGSYGAMRNEGIVNRALRAVVGYCLLGITAMHILFFLLPKTHLGGSVLFWAVMGSIAGVLVFRTIFTSIVDLDRFNRRVLVYGSGKLANRIVKQSTKLADSLALTVVGCVPSQTDAEPHEDLKDLALKEPEDWVTFCHQQHISEIIVAPDERRRSMGGHMPVEEFLDCKMEGIQVIDAPTFFERELSMIEIELVQPGWMLFSDGFQYSHIRDWSKRLFDIAVSLLLVLIASPFMILAGLAVVLETGRPMFYKQVRVGLNGKEFTIYKLRSMAQNAEKGGKAVWAQKNDARVTKVGAFIRNTRLDELPQLLNVLRGDMSFVGPRPERPQFVNELKEQIPYYDVRHRVKPGLMGWAQLKYPYGASVEDTENKLRYDLYYTKNHSFFMDLLILIQTVEVVLLGKGVH